MVSSPTAANGAPEGPTLADLEFRPYLDDRGQLPTDCDGAIAVYAIFDRDRALQFVGYSRNAGTSLVQHLVRQPDRCHWVKLHAIARPSRALLEDIRDRWIAEAGATPPGNGPEAATWTQAIDATRALTEAERAAIDAAIDDRGRVKALKKAVRRVQGDREQQLAARGVGFDIRFDPKLKERGLLDVN